LPCGRAPCSFLLSCELAALRQPAVCLTKHTPQWRQSQMSSWLLRVRWLRWLKILLGWLLCIIIAVADGRPSLDGDGLAFKFEVGSGKDCFPVVIKFERNGAGNTCSFSDRAGSLIERHAKILGRINDHRVRVV